MVTIHEELARRQEQHPRLCDQSNDAVFVIELEQVRILGVNARACTMLGYSREELLNLPISAVHPNEMPAMLAFTRSVSERGIGLTDELTFTTRSGQSLPAQISASILDVEGRLCILARVREISARQKAEVTLQQHLEQLERTVEECSAQPRRSEERQRVLLEINDAIATRLDWESLLRAIGAALSQVLPFDAASIRLYDRERDSFRLAALDIPGPPGPGFDLDSELDRRTSHVGWVFDHGLALVRNDLGLDRRFSSEERLRAAGIRSYVAVPLAARSSVIGTFNLGSRTPCRYSEEDGRLLREVAKRVGLAVQNALAFEEIARLKALLEQEKLYLQEEIKNQHDFEQIVGRSQAFDRVLRAVKTVAATNATVLITGETGTGKELVAVAVHALSAEKDQPLVRVNCAALAPGLIESELFGHERGAFTGAVSRRVGRFEIADRGTLFLDEIGDLALDLQGKLLRVLQEGEFERVGGSRTIRVKVRVIAATNRDLEKALREQRFREDLYYRLSVFPIRIPPLRERREDIPLLVGYFMAKHATRMNKNIDSIRAPVMDALMAYSWPGNVRELENVIERAIIVSRGSKLELGDWSPNHGEHPVGQRISTLDELQREHIIRVLDRTGWRIRGANGAGRTLGLKPTTLEARMKKLGIQRSS